MATRYRLSNGLTVVFEQQRQAPVVAFQVWVKVGSADETPDEVGLAHLHEHMLFKGTAKRGLGEIARSVEAHGGEINAWTSFDQTVYHVVMASRHAWQGLDVLADAVQHSAFDAGELSREIEVVCEEIKRSLDMPSRRASKALFQEAFTTHPYGRPVIGFEANVRAHTRDRVLSFYKKHYRPENMVLSAVGDFDEAELRKQVEALFGAPPAPLVASAPFNPRVREPDFTNVRVKLTEDELVSSVILLLNAGHEATVHQTGNAVRAILAQGGDPRRFFATPEATVATVEECLRFDAPPGRYPNMLVFNLANTGEVQFLDMQAAGTNSSQFKLTDVEVVKPFGADHLITIWTAESVDAIGAVLADRNVTAATLLDALKTRLDGKEASVAIQPLYTRETL